MNVTIKDVEKFINSMCGSKSIFSSYVNNVYIIKDGKIFISDNVKYYGYNHETLPNGIVHLIGASCDLGGSNIQSLPDDIVLNDNLYTNGSQIKEINVDVGGFLDIRNSDVVLKEGIYIGRELWSADYEIDDEMGYISPIQTPYSYLDSVNIHGYLFITGILS